MRPSLLKRRSDFDVWHTSVRILDIDTEGIGDKGENSIPRDHDEHTHDSPNHVLFSLLVVASLIEFDEEFNQSPHEEEETSGKDNDDERVYHVVDKPAHYIAYRRHIDLVSRIRRCATVSASSRPC